MKMKLIINTKDCILFAMVVILRTLILLIHMELVVICRRFIDSNGRLDSVRKDVECTFGVLKARFRILRNGMRFHKKNSC
jgi:Plant transposon protein